MPSPLVSLYRMLRYGAPLLRMKPNSSFTVADLIEDTVRRRAQHPFVLFEGRSVSYDAYNREANRVAHWGLAQGLLAGDVVALLMQNRPEFLSVWAGLAIVNFSLFAISPAISSWTANMSSISRS